MSRLFKGIPYTAVCKTHGLLPKVSEGIRAMPAGDQMIEYHTCVVVCPSFKGPIPPLSQLAGYTSGCCAVHLGSMTEKEARRIAFETWNYANR